MGCEHKPVWLSHRSSVHGLPSEQDCGVQLKVPVPQEVPVVKPGPVESEPELEAPPWPPLPAAEADEDDVELVVAAPLPHAPDTASVSARRPPNPMLCQGVCRCAGKKLVILPR